jgi:hypothetical protein
MGRTSIPMVLFMAVGDPDLVVACQWGTVLDLHFATRAVPIVG